MTEPAPKAVVFDVGNVLIRWDPKNLYRAFGLPDAEIDRRLALTGLMEANLEFDRGAPFAAGVAAIAARFPDLADFVTAFDTGWERMLAGAIEPNVALLARLKAAGVPVHAITNFARVKFDRARVLFPFLDDFDELVVSADVGLIKPDPAIFELLLARTGLAAGEAVFIDDSAKNVATAGRLGFRTVHVTDETVDVTAALAAMGLAV